MFLATTAQREFWGETDDIVYLSSWCLRKGTFVASSSARLRIVPNPWDDRQRYHQAGLYLSELHERWLRELSGQLDIYHAESHSVRYWRILIGPWLWRYLCLCYDRYSRLQTALESHRDLTTLTLVPESFVTPNDTDDFLGLWREHLFNLQIISQILFALGHSFPSKGAVQERTARPQRTIQVSTGTESPPVPNRAPGVLLHEMYCSGEVFGALVAATRSWFRGFATQARVFSNLPPAQMSRRLDLSRLTAANEFEACFAKILPVNFPMLWLEGLKRARAAVFQMGMPHWDVIVSSNAWETNEVFKLYAAEAAEQGARLVTVQHGGGYGLHRRDPFEDAESQTGDSFYAWGWAPEAASHLKNAPSLQVEGFLCDLRRTARLPQPRTVLFISTDDPYYKASFSSIPTPEQYEEYFEWQLRFLAALPIGMLEHVFYRRYVHDFGRHTVERLRHQFPALQFDDMQNWHRTLADRLQSARVVVVDHNQTTMLYALAANVPTVLFWDANLWEIRDKAMPDVEALRELGVLWDSPEAAAGHVAKIYLDPHKWWSNLEIQKARRAFLRRYAYSSDNWAREWQELLWQEIELNRRGQSKAPTRTTPAPDSLRALHRANRNDVRAADQVEVCERLRRALTSLNDRAFRSATMKPVQSVS